MTRLFCQRLSCQPSSLQRLRLLLGRRVSCSAVLLATLMGAPVAVHASALDTINQLCLAGFSAAVSGSGKSAPEGMASYTCDCFVDRVSQRISLAEAQATCTRLASSRFKLQ
jgi:hypothetical protein